MNLNPEKQQPTPDRIPIRTFEFEGKKVSVFEKKEGIASLQELDSLAEQNQKGETIPKKVLLIDFKTLEVVQENQNYSFQNFINLGVHRLAGYLEDYHVPVNIVRYGGMKDKIEELFKLVSEYDIVGVSNLTSQVEDTYKLCLEIKKSSVILN